MPAVDASRRRNENALYIFAGRGLHVLAWRRNVASHILDTLVAGGNVQANVVAMAAILSGDCGVPRAAQEP
ncbi:MAG: hypothetical protein ACLSDQ_08425 [Adlercreutzia equolifaciens]